MALGCGGQFMKIMLFIFNGLFFLGGAALLGIGIWLLVDPNIADRFSQIATDQGGLFKAAAITACVIGGLIFVIGFFGCCGACRENQCMLCTFVVCMSILLTLEVVVVILVAVFRNDIQKGLVENMQEQAVKEVLPLLPEGNEALSLTWHHMQYDFKCCGGVDYRDYYNNTNFKNMAKPVPKTCCMMENGNIEEAKAINYTQCKKEFLMHDVPETTLQLHKQGCYDGLVNWLQHKAGILIGVAAAIIVVEILGIIFGCCVRNELVRKKEYV